MAESSMVWAATRNASAAVFFRAPLGTAAPTDAIGALNVAFKDHGWLTADGIVNAISRDVTRHKGFGGDTIKITQDDYTETIKVVLAETNPETLKTTFGESNVTVVTTPYRKITVNHTQAMLPRSMFVVQFIDAERTGRILIREGQVTEVDDIVYKHDEMTVYTLTIDVFKPAAGGEAVTLFLDEPNAPVQPDRGALVLSGKVPTVP